MRVDPDETAEAKRLGDTLSRFVGQVPGEWHEHAAARDRPMLDLLSLAANGPRFPRSLPGLFLGMPFAADGWEQQ